MRRLLIITFLLAGCESGPVVIDGRRDALIARPDGGALDGSLDGGSMGFDSGMRDGGACLPNRPPAWVPVDTGGPASESLSDCMGRVGSMTDDRVPVGQGYDLTTFGGAGDVQSVSCGAADADGSWYYAANAQRFSCGRRMRVVDAARTRCVIVEVADIGPEACVEEAGGQPIFDVSPLASQALFMVDSVGYTEHRAVFAAPVDNGNPLGPCDHIDAPSSILRGFIGGPCDSPGDCSYTGADCLTESEGFPGGTCSQDCDSTCPDEVGPHAFTACAALDDGTRHCFQRCDYSLFETGCRDGYSCELKPPPSGSGSDRYVCLPLPCL